MQINIKTRKLILDLFFKNPVERAIFFKKLKNLQYELFGNKYILISASVHPYFKNWGDDISTVIAEFINPSLKVIPAKYSFNIKNKREILCVGSIISWLTKPQSIIWGSGIQFPEDEIIYENKVIKPHKVLAVRGPLTRKHLLDRGIDCPEVYGDPAMLFPKFYTPPKIKKYKIGILPHFKDKKSAKVKKLLKLEGTHFIDIQDSTDWRKLIDDITSCEFILSSTLHGIIIADSYGIPNAWVEYDKVELKRFTFQDYFLSVNKDIMEPENLSKISNTNDIIALKSQWKAPEIDLKKLLDSCPFKKK